MTRDTPNVLMHCGRSMNYSADSWFEAANSVVMALCSQGLPRIPPTPIVDVVRIFH